MTPLFPGWHLPTLRKKPKSSMQKLLEDKKAIERNSISSLNKILGRYIPSSILSANQTGSFSRRRIFSLENTFWGFFYQVLNPDKSCQAVVNQLRVRLSQFSEERTVSQSTSAYCQARKKLPLNLLKDVFYYTSQSKSPTDSDFLQGRRVVVVDGTGVSMPDTSKNQEHYPQPKSQKLGCGFPQARICACFDLNTGLALSYQLGNKKSHELPLLRKQFDTFKTGDIFLGDKGFISFADTLALKEKGVDSVIGLAKRKPVLKADADQILGNGDLLIHWNKTPKNRTITNQGEWNALPNTLKLRQIRVWVDIPGYRPKHFYVVTTLLDPIKYPAEQIRKLYLKRWKVEVYFRDLKTTLGMDILRGKSPDMIEKEILMFFIVYNAIKILAKDSIQSNDKNPSELSFNACRQVVVNYAQALNTKAIKLPKLLNLIRVNKLNERPNRVEPRVVKRRPKPFKLMVKPRSELKAELLLETNGKVA